MSLSAFHVRRKPIELSHLLLRTQSHITSSNQQIYNYRPTSIYCANFSASNTSTSSVSSKSNSAASSSFTTA